MTRQAKERLLGFLVLLAMAAIFLPMLLDGEGVRQGRLLAVIPDQPEPADIVHYQPQTQPHEDSAVLAEPQRAKDLQLRPPTRPLTTVAGGQSSKTADVKRALQSRMATVKPVLDQQGVPTGWTLQLASFKERDNAVTLQRRLSQLGYKAYLRDKGDLSKVFVGPDLQKAVIEGLKVELKRKLKLDGLVLRFRP